MNTNSTAQLTFASDLDGVGYLFNEVLAGWLVGNGHPVEKITAPTTYSLVDAYGLADQAHLDAEVRAAFAAGIMWWTGDAYLDALAANHEIVAAGHRFVFVTARNAPGICADAAESATRSWLTAAGFLFDDVILSHDKHLVPFDVLLDDSPNNVRTCLAHGRNALLLDRPWNHTETLPLVTWDQMPGLCDRLAGRVLADA